MTSERRRSDPVVGIALQNDQIEISSGFTSREDMVAHTLRLMRWRAEGRFDAIAGLLADEMVMYLPGVPGQNPFNGTFRGKDACLTAMRENFILIEFADVRARGVIVEGDTVVVNWVCRMRNRGAGPMLPAEGMGRIRYRHGLVYYYSNHFDTAVVGALSEFPPLRI